MATYRKRDDPLVSCPYNPAHRMLQSRLQLHLTKCKKDHPEADMKTCPFNAKHRVSSAEFSHHLVVCPDKGIVERKIAYERSEYSGNTQVPSYTNSMPPPVTTDYWDDQCYDRPEAQAEKNTAHIYKDMTFIQDMKPAQRRNYYKSLSKGVGVEDERPTEEPVCEPEQSFVRKVLKEARQPRSRPEDMIAWPCQPNSAQWSGITRENDLRSDSQNSGLGRGFSNRRIAANIFGPSHSGTEAQLYSPNYIMDGITTLNLGRGRGALGASITEPSLRVDDYPPIPHGRVNNVL